MEYKNNYRNGDMSCPSLHETPGYIHGRSGAKTRRSQGVYSATSASQRLGGYCILCNTINRLTQVSNGFPVAILRSPAMHWL